jgi:hypothetical protein
MQKPIHCLPPLYAPDDKSEEAKKGSKRVIPASNESIPAGDESIPAGNES